MVHLASVLGGDEKLLQGCILGAASVGRCLGR
jgi:hypothetical protein